MSNPNCGVPTTYVNESAGQLIENCPCSSSSNYGNLNNDEYANCPTGMFNIDISGFCKHHRYYNLISNWNSMTYDEKIATFLPCVQHEYLADIEKGDWSDYINQKIFDFSMKTGRPLQKIDMENSHQSVGQYCMVFGPIDTETLPEPFKSEYTSFGVALGFIKHPTVNCEMY